MLVHGTLQHITFIYQQGQSSLPTLSSFISKFPNEFAWHHILNSVLECLKWWIAILQNPSNSCSLKPCTIIDPHIWVDASTDWGIGIINGHLWAAWRLRAGWRSDGQDIGWVKLIMLELAVIWLVQDGYMDCNITIHGDDMGLIGAFDKGCSRNIACNDSIQQTASAIILNNITISPVYTPSTSNMVDLISCSILGPLSLCLQEPLQLPEELTPFLTYI